MTDEAFPSTTVRVRCPEGTCFVRVGFIDGEPRHIYTHVGKAGSQVQAAADAICRSISRLLELGAPLDQTVGLLRDITHDRSGGPGMEARSLAEAVAIGVSKATAAKEPS